MAGIKVRSFILTALMLFLSLVFSGCQGPYNGQQQEASLQQETPTGQYGTAGEEDLQPIEQVPDETAAEEVLPDAEDDQYPGVFIRMLENHPLHRQGELSPDKRYYAYEERSSIILVQLPAPEEYEADKTLLPKVLFLDGLRKGAPFAELEEDYALRLQHPLLSEEELNEIRNKMRSVYDWRYFYNQKFSQNSQYLAYLGYDNFGSDRTCTVYVLDIRDSCRIYTFPVEENSWHEAITWLADDETLEILVPHAVVNEGRTLELRHKWHIPSGKTESHYFTEDGMAVAPDEVQKAIAAYELAKEESSRTEKEWIELSVEEMVAELTPEELAAEYARYYTLHEVQIRELRERGYSEEVIAGMDSIDFEREEKNWFLREDMIVDLKYLYPQLEDVDLTKWTIEDYENFVRVENEKLNGPPPELKLEILERGLPEDLTSYIAKEFHGWENMLAYTNEAIMAMYEAKWETDALFRKGEAYRLAVREAYLEQIKDN